MQQFSSGLEETARNRRPLARGVALIALGIVATFIAGVTAFHWLDARLGGARTGAVHASSPARPRTTGRVLGSIWTEGLFAREARDNSGDRRRHRAARSTFDDDDDDEGDASRRWARSRPERASRPAPAQTYRTVCVRLCDGYFFPMSFSASADQMHRDVAQCESSCSSPARLYTQRGTGADLDAMVDLDGRPYSKLPTANLFRSTYNPSCACKPQPWSQAALDRHRMFALEAERDKGRATAVAELNELRARVRQRAMAERTARSARPGVGSKRGGSTGIAIGAAAPAAPAELASASPSPPEPAPLPAVSSVAGQPLTGQPLTGQPLTGQPLAVGGLSGSPGEDEARQATVHRHARQASREASIRQASGALRQDRRSESKPPLGRTGFRPAVTSRCRPRLRTAGLRFTFVTNRRRV